MKAPPTSPNPEGTHRINLGVRYTSLPPNEKKHVVYVLGCPKCRAELADDGVNVNISCDATTEDNPNGHPSVVMGMDEIGEDG